MLWEVGKMDDAFNVKKIVCCSAIIYILPFSELHPKTGVFYNLYPAKLRKLSLRAMAVRHLGQR